jgi:hypothetical protein
LTKKTKKIEEKKRKEKKSKENHQKSGLAAVVEMDASNAILMDASLHNYRLDGDGEGDGDGGGDGIDEYDESLRHHLLYLLVRAERIDDLMFKFVRTHIHDLEELKIYTFIIVDACMKGFAGCSSSCIIMYKNLYVDYTIKRLQLLLVH